MAAADEKASLWGQRLDGLTAEASSLKQDLTEAQEAAQKEARLSQQRLEAAMAEAGQLEAITKEAAAEVGTLQAEVEALSAALSEARQASKGAQEAAASEEQLPASNAAIRSGGSSASAQQQPGGDIAALRAEVEQQRAANARWVLRVKGLTSEAAAAEERLGAVRAEAAAQVEASQAQLEAALAKLAHLESARSADNRAEGSIQRQVRCYIGKLDVALLSYTLPT